MCRKDQDIDLDGKWGDHSGGLTLWFANYLSESDGENGLHGCCTAVPEVASEGADVGNGCQGEKAEGIGQEGGRQSQGWW